MSQQKEIINAFHPDYVKTYHPEFLEYFRLLTIQKRCGESMTKFVNKKRKSVPSLMEQSSVFRTRWFDMNNNEIVSVLKLALDLLRKKEWESCDYNSNATEAADILEKVIAEAEKQEPVAMAQVYRCKIKSRKQIDREIPRDKQGWWADISAGQLIRLREATQADVDRCTLNEAHSKNPADYMCETHTNGSLVSKVALEYMNPDQNVFAAIGSTHPQPAPAQEPVAWQSLSESETETIANEFFLRPVKLIREVEEKIKFKNTHLQIKGEQKPVAWGFQNTAITGSFRWMMLREEVPSNDQYGGALWTPLYTHPQPAQPKREWVGLTDDEIDAEVDKEEQAHGFIQGVAWAETKLKEKNT